MSIFKNTSWTRPLSPGKAECDKLRPGRALALLAQAHNKFLDIEMLVLGEHFPRIASRSEVNLIPLYSRNSLKASNSVFMQ
jgi:hypothetical protein